MEAYHFRAPTAAELEGTGLKPKHYPEPEVEVWPEMWAAFELYMRLQNQWRCGPGGPIGLDYVVVNEELRYLEIKGEEREEVMRHVRIIESAAIKELVEDG